MASLLVMVTSPRPAILKLLQFVRHTGGTKCTPAMKNNVVELLPSSSPADLKQLMEVLSKRLLWSRIVCRLSHGCSGVRPQVAMSEEPLAAEMYQTTSVGVAPRTAANATAANSQRDARETGNE